MLRIPLHIERILLVNDCVIIPDFGGFILRRLAAVHKTRECAFLPARKEIVFNPTLTHNDGLLAESYMEMYGMDFNEAQQAIRHDVSALLAQLDEEGILRLDAIGTLRRNDDGALLFDPIDRTPLYGIGSYGLPLFYMPPLSPEPSEAQPINQPTVPDSIPVTRRLIPESVKAHLPAALRVVGQTAAVAAVACAFYFTVSTPVKEVDRSAYTAGFVPSELLHDLSEKTPAAPPAPVPEIQPEGEGQTKTQKAAEKKRYRIVIASLDRLEAAEQLVSKLTPADRARARIRMNGVVRKIRVIIGDYTDRKEAEAELARWRKNPKFETAWLIVGP